MKTFEYTTITYEEAAKECAEIKEQAFRDGFETYLEKQKIKDALNLYNSKLRTNNFAGVIKYKNFQLDILPKLLSRKIAKSDEYGVTKQSDINSADIEKEAVPIIKNLLFMISKTENLEIKTTDYADISNCENPFFEVLIREYAVSLFECLKRLTPRNYVREEDNLNYLKGKLKFTENIRCNCANKAKFYCEYDEFSENNELNRLFLYVSKCLFNVSKNTKNKQVLSFIMNYFCDLPLVKTDKYKAEKIILTRNQKLFDLPFKLAKMFLSRISVDISKNTIENITILWDMNKLFEEFVYQLLRKGQKDYTVNYQKQCCLLRKIGNDKEFRDTYTDIFLEKEDGKNKEEKEKIVLDTKYKIGSFANADIYQVCTYCLLHSACHAVLFYPMEYKENNKDYFKKGSSYKLNTTDTKKEIFIHRIYINLYHNELKKIFNNVKDFNSKIQQIKEQ